MGVARARVWISALCLAPLFAACVSTRPAPVVQGAPTARAASQRALDPRPEAYEVKRGDTLYSIALEHGVDWHDLATWNFVSDPTKLAVGQSLRVKPPKTSVAGAPTFDGPVQVTPIAIAQPLVGKSIEEGAPKTASTASSASGEPKVPKAGATTATSSSPSPSAAGASGTQAAVQAAAPVATSAPPAITSATQGAAPAQPVAVLPSAKTDSPRPDPTKSEPDEEIEAPGGMDWEWPANGKLTQKFAEAGSKGIQISGRSGDPVVASAPGKVTYVGDGIRGYGNLVIVKHNEKYLSVYAHAKRALVQGGQTVAKGQRIAEMGGLDSSRNLLHFEIRRFGKPVDPLQFLPGRID